MSATQSLPISTNKRALLSVSDKTGLVDFARGLLERGFELVSTGGTYNSLTQAGLSVTYIADVTGFPEILEGRVKTLHPNIHGGILAKRTPEHLAELAAHNITPIDLVCVNLYPFRETIAKADVALDEALENIDIGGPTMLRAAAKNFPAVLIVTNPQDYALVLENVDAASLDFRKNLARQAFDHIASYDRAIADYLLADTLADTQPADPKVTLALTPIEGVTLRYGENPHQAAQLYRLSNERGPVLDAAVLAGKPMGFNNYADADAAWLLVSEFEAAACVAVKHANPCGVALADNAHSAWELARDADTLSVFGGVVAFNRSIDLATAQAMRGTFLEVMIAPAIDQDALTWLREKKPDLRVLKAAAGSFSSQEYRQLAGGFLAQARDQRRWQDLAFSVATTRQPTEAEWQDLQFAWYVAKHARSNNVVLARNQVTVGLGAGAVSRIWAAERAVHNAGQRAAGAVLASEAFFPFDDVVRLAGAAGVTAIIQPGGAKRDPEVIAAANELGMAMVFTGSRHFKH
jgi:phosphoribosylaminoimidazolecarboxamide formyltransferase / IMP cyclohydrolase